MAPQPGQRASRVRLGILALITAATMLNYLDRSVLGVAKPALSAELDISPAVMGLIFSAFSWTYALAQVPGGYVLDRFGTKSTYGVSLALWSIATALHGFASGIAGLLASRLALGLAESPCFPANSRVLASWFPQGERARANSVYAVGQYVGLGLLIPLLGWIVATWGWRSLFWLVGGIGVVFAGIWFLAFREPLDSKANAAELDHIRAGGGLSTGTAPPFSWSMLGRLMRKRQVLGASIGQFCGNSTLVFFLTWFPSYLADERGMDFLKSGWAAALPYLAASVGVLVGGQVSDWLIRRTGSATLGRKLPIIVGLLLTSTMVAANFTDSNEMVIAIMSLAFFGQGMVNLGWTLITDVAPKEAVGVTGGLFSLCANLAGIITPLVIGFTVEATGSFYAALAYIAALGLVGALAYVVVVGPVVRVTLD
ncbi:MAG: MFS transporter [Sandarakinorhabdus sp.]|jgi:ACS family D-galactonate transporter-like MFS transporter